MGESGDRLTRAAKVLEQLTGGQTPVFSKGEICPPSIPFPCLDVVTFHCALLPALPLPLKSLRFIISAPFYFFRMIRLGIPFDLTLFRSSFHHQNLQHSPQ